MAEPIFTDTLERLYGRLPEYLRRADTEQDWALKRFLALLVDQADELEVVLDRLDYRAPFDGGSPSETSELVDPYAADLAWLAWLAQHVGVRLDPELTELEQRDAIASSSAGWRAGTKVAVQDAAASALTGTRYAKVYDHSTDASALGGAGEWDVLVVTRTSETPDPAIVLKAIVDKGAKPAGVVLYHRAYEADWATIEAAYPTWADWHAAGTWAAIMETGL